MRAAGALLAAAAAVASPGALGAGAPGAPLTVTITGGADDDSIPYNKTVTLTVKATNVPPDVSPTIVLTTAGGPPNSQHLECTLTQQNKSCFNPVTNDPATADTSVWTPPIPSTTATTYTVKVTLNPWGLPAGSTLSITFYGTLGSPPLYVKPGATSGQGGPEVSGKVTVKCGSSFSAEPEASAGYKVGDKVSLDGTITLTVPCGIGGKPAAAPKPVVATALKGATAQAPVTIAGAGLGGASQVLFGTHPATSFKVVSPYEILAVPPPGSGTVTIVVIGPKGRSPASHGARYTYP